MALAFWCGEDKGRRGKRRARCRFRDDAALLGRGNGRKKKKKKKGVIGGGMPSSHSSFLKHGRKERGRGKGRGGWNPFSKI